MKKTVKIILHHKVNQKVDSGPTYSTWKIIAQLPIYVINLIISASYHIGLILISIPKLPKKFISLLKKLSSHSFSRPNFNKALGFVLLIILAITPIYLLRLASEGQKVGGRILGISDTVINDVNSAQSALKQQDFTLAQNNFANILQNLNVAQTELNNSSIFLQSIVNFAPASYNTGNALKAAQLLTESAQIGSGLLAQVGTISFSPEGLSFSDNQNTREGLLKIKADISAIDSKLSEANTLLSPLDTGSLPANYQSPLKDSQSLVADLSTKMHALKTASDLLINLVMGDKNFLAVLQNNNELRPTGGFIGTIAQGQLVDASIKHLDIRSVYDLDGQLLSWVTPPYPIRAVNNRWFLRDANWLTSFPESAQRLSVMYEQEGGETPDLIFAITPDLFIDLLNKTGPITLPRYKVTVSSSNFIEQIQTTTSVAYDKSLNQPKQLLADLYPILLQKISQDKGGILGLLDLMQQNLTNKNLLVYSRDPDLEQVLKNFRWAGEVSKSDKDYLQVNSANLGGTKTDRALSRTVNLQTTIQPDGTIIDQVRYTINNPLPNSPGLLNRSFVRFLIPQGSTILAADGFNELSLVDLPKFQKYTTDPVIDDWNHNLQYDQNHKVYLGKESGKNFVANWVEVAGGETKTVTITYQLPIKLDTLDNYSLLWEKQSGMLPFAASQDINFQGKTLVWDNLGNQNREVSKPDAGDTSWKLTSMAQDQFVGLVLNKGK